KVPPDNDALFRAFSFKGHSYIDFNEFFLGLAVIGLLGQRNLYTDLPSKTKLSTKRVHSSAVAKFQANFLFHYYGAHHDRLSLDELNYLASEFSIRKLHMIKLKKASKSGFVSKSSFIALTEKWLLASALSP